MSKKILHFDRHDNEEFNVLQIFFFDECFLKNNNNNLIIGWGKRKNYKNMGTAPGILIKNAFYILKQVQSFIYSRKKLNWVQKGKVFFFNFLHANLHGT